ncbi:MAG: SpoIIE family protein phosphatase [Acidobacteriaceae bacterium]|nr:SpoIIE family protein phosphatase [Acidobacteriaceae bacterium]
MRYLWLFCLSASLWGQTLDLSRFQNGSTSLAGLWKFHAGDDPRWANPNFDDSSWKLVKVPSSLDKQGYPNFSGYGWYRRELRMNAAIAAQDLQLIIGSGFGAYEVYANGNRIGRLGSFPPEERLYYLGRSMSFVVPKIRRSGQNRLVLAFRFWVPVRFAPPNMGGLNSSPIEIGTASVIENMLAAEKRRQMLSWLPAALVNGIMMILAVILLAIYSFDRRPEYLLLGLRFAANAFVLVVIWLVFDTFLLTIGQAGIIASLLECFATFFAVYGIWSLLEVPVGRWAKMFLFAYIAFGLSGAWAFQRGAASTLTLGSIASAIDICLSFTIVIFILRRSPNIPEQTRWLAASFVPYYLITALRNTPVVVPALARLINPEFMQLLLSTVSVVTAVAFGYFLLRRFGAARAEQERLHTELETARQVQLLMLPSQSVTIPNLRVETVYLPAQEVGGDFFQIAQTRDGSLLIVIGDVSGKGLKAALTVSLIVGLWQEVIDGSEHSPRHVLSWLNEQLLRRVHEGFVTCLCVRLSTDGSLTVANAGHLAPFVNGQELVTDNGLPLGISAEAEYNETQHVLAPEDTLTLISDGVVEARDKTRKLFGFERLQQALSQHLEADAIARSAQQFGQEDDITVISISRQPAAVKPLPQAAPMSVSSPISS